jgi:hypothetical protein
MVGKRVGGGGNGISCWRGTGRCSGAIGESE